MNINLCSILMIFCIFQSAVFLFSHKRGDYSSGHRNHSLCAIYPVSGTHVHLAIHLVERKWGNMQLTYIMLMACGVGWMVYAFSQLMHNKSHEITHLVTYIVWPHWQKLQPKRSRA